MPKPRSPLDSPSIGTATNDLIESCRAPDQPGRDRPAPPDRLPALSVAFSGGGFRATLTAVGVGRFLADAGLLGRVRCLSSVSGGSLANALVARAWDELAAGGFSPAGYDRLVVSRLIDRISTRSLTASLARNLWKTLGPRTRTDLLAQRFDEWFLGGMLLEELSPAVRWVFNAANVTTGVRFGFERNRLGDWVLGTVPSAGTRFPVARAAAASAAVPGAFAPVEIDLPFPCANGRKALLLDGGAYDNLGLEVIDRPRDDTFLVCMNAGGTFQTGAYGRIPLVRELKRANGLLYRQTMALRMRTMVERMVIWERARDQGTHPPEWARRGVLFALATTMGDRATPEWLDGRPEPSRSEIEELALTPTSFGKFPRALCERLVYRGWWLAGATISAYHRDLLDALPTWRPLGT